MSGIRNPSSFVIEPIEKEYIMEVIFMFHVKHQRTRTTCEVY